MNRQMGRQAEQAASKRQKTKKTLVRAVGAVVVILAIFFGIAFLTKNDPTTPADTTPADTNPSATTPTDASSFTYGTTPCAPTDGAATATQDFKDSFALCIDPALTYIAVVTTNLGSYTAVLDAKTAPGTVNNFVNLARSKYFDNTTCHRAIPGFMVQCGDPTATGSGGPGYSFADELPQAGQYKLGSLVMANAGADTNGSQFFVITGDQGIGLPPDYALFGQITDGLDTTLKDLDAAGNADPNANGVPPLKEIKILSVTITQI